MALHGSSIPGALEGAPFHNDSFMLTFNAEANASGTLVYIGAVLTLAVDADFTCKVTLLGTEFVLGVAQTSGQLSSAIDVICRGIVTVTCDVAVTAGDLLFPSATALHNGYVNKTGVQATMPSRMIALQTVNGAGTPAPIQVLLF
jgi:hypothetical protein